MKKILTLLIPLFFSFLLFAHEFWLQPDKFIYKWNDPVSVRFFVGENFTGEIWKGNASRINSLDLYFSGVKDDISYLLSEEEGDSLELKILDEGTTMITFNSNNSYIELESSKFNSYLLEDGLTEPFEYRVNNRESDIPGREYYQRSVKTIFQVGNKYNNTFKMGTSLPVDIIPQQNPYLLKSNDSIAVKILFRNEPVSNQLVKIWHKNNGRVKKHELLTDDSGLIKFSIETKGTWMISTVKMERLENNENADWQSYWGSCTWGYE